MYEGTVTTPDPMLAWKIENMPDGYSGYVRYDEAPSSPRDWARIATIVNLNCRHVDIDDDSADLAEVRGHYALYDEGRTNRSWDSWYWEKYVKRSKWSREDMVNRYLRIFRPDILLYVDRWSAGRESYGWGYVTREDWEACMGADYPGMVTPQIAFDQEVETFRQYAEGEVYGVTVVRDEDGAEASLWGIFDPYPHEYLEKTVVAELIEEIEK